MTHLSCGTNWCKKQLSILPLVFSFVHKHANTLQAAICWTSCDDLTFDESIFCTSRYRRNPKKKQQKIVIMKSDDIILCILLYSNWKSFVYRPSRHLCLASSWLYKSSRHVWHGIVGNNLFLTAVAAVQGKSFHISLPFTLLTLAIKTTKLSLFCNENIMIGILIWIFSGDWLLWFSDSWKVAYDTVEYDAHHSSSYYVDGCVKNGCLQW